MEDSEQLTMFNGAEENTDVKVIEKEDKITVVTHERKKHSTHKDSFENLETEEVIHKAEEKVCPECGSEMKVIDKEFVRDELVYVPARMFVRKHYVEKTCCVSCGIDENRDNEREDDIPKQVFGRGNAPAALISGSFCSPELLAHILYYPFNITKEFLDLQDDERNYIKMLLRVEETIAKCFLKKVLIVEGDTEQVVLSETISRLPESLKNDILSGWYILRARGKAAIIPLIKYLKAMQIDIYVMHDMDENTAGAKKFNEPIKQALNNDNHLYVLKNCVEDVLGYSAPNFDKPYKAYCYINEQWSEWETVNENWKKIMQDIFNEGKTIEYCAE